MNILLFVLALLFGCAFADEVPFDPAKVDDAVVTYVVPCFQKYVCATAEKDGVKYIVIADDRGLVFIFNEKMELLWAKDLI